MSPISLLGVLLLFSVAVQCEELTASNYDPMTDALDDDLEREQDPLIYCSICKWLSGKVLERIGNIVSRNNIDRALQGLCSRLIFTEDCYNFLMKYKQKLVDAIASGNGGETVCSTLRMCYLYPFFP
ncbi:hypothetical protein MHYP_G00141560 [Metynnis hypsauchen]